MELFDEQQNTTIKHCLVENTKKSYNTYNFQYENDDTEIIYKVEDNLSAYNDWIRLYEDDFVSFSFKDPYLYINIKKTCPENDDLEKMFVYMNRFYNENENLMFGKIYNLSNMGMVAISDIHTFSQSLKKLEEKTNKQVYSSSIIIKNAIVKTVLDMFLKLYKNTRPIKVVENLKDAKLFIKDERRKYREDKKLRSIDPNNQGVF
jgi:hypothetical protein